MKAFFPLLLTLPLALGACSTSSDAALAARRAPTSASISTADLTSYHWQLSQAVDADHRRIDALFDQSTPPLQLDFSDQRISVSHACNAISGSFQVIDGHLQAKLLMHTMMACMDPVLQQRETVIEALLRGSPSLTLSGSEAAPRLTLVATSGQTLTFAGKATAQKRFQGPGETLFLEVAAHTVPCGSSDPAGDACLRVRERHDDAQGLSHGQPGPWHAMPQSIEDFTRQDGVHYVLRVKRYAQASGARAAYVLDGIVESGPPQPSD